MQIDYYPCLTSFEDVARHYRRKYASQIETEMKWFSSRLLLKKLPEVIERACESVIYGEMHPHQWPFEKIRPQAPKKAIELLKPSASSIESARDFHELYSIISTKLKSVKGIGPLAYYDFARRIGAWLCPILEPTEVYLHCDTKKGAEAVSVRVNRESAPMSDFPEGLRSPKGLQPPLTAVEMEDILCIYCGTLARIAGKSQGGTNTTSQGIPRCVVLRQRCLANGRCCTSGAASDHSTPCAAGA
jgi:hypothetical protein